MPTKPPTQSEAIIAALEARGAKRVPGRSSRYIIFERPASWAPNGEVIFYFVGKAGALRAGRTVSDSFALSESLRRHFIHEGLAIIRERS